MAKHIHSKTSSVAAEEEGFEVVAKTCHMMSYDDDPEMPTDAEDQTVGLDDGDDNFAASTTTNVDRRSGCTMKRWSIGATAMSVFLIAIVVALVVIKQPAADDNTSVVAAAAKRVANNNLLASECCVNTATNTCHAIDKCNKKEKECQKCNKKTSDEYAWMLPGGGVPPEPREPDITGGETTDGAGGTIENPCCAIVDTNTCHENNKCNEKQRNCENKKCQKNGTAVWKVPSQQSPAPTSNPTSSPTTEAPSKAPTSEPTPSPTKNNSVPATPAPTAAPTATSTTVDNDPTVYEYTDTGKSCSIGGGNNVQGPTPLADKSNVVVEFWAWGDSPYDFLVDTCLDKNGDPSTCKDCAKKNSEIDEIPWPNTCTFEGDDFKCVKDSIIPFMNRKMNNGVGAFQVHLGDILKGTNSAANSRRCTTASFDSRAKLFEPAKNFMLINGDNESNECMGYDITKPSDPIRTMWRDRFGKYAFTSDFPGGGRPTVSRMEGNEEIFGFQYKKVAFFGLDYPQGDTYITTNAPVDLNAKFVKESLASDTSCELKSIVIFTHVDPEKAVDDELGDYFKRCGVLPILTAVGNAHPKTYCLTKKDERLKLTVEAFQSGPVLVSILRDSGENGGDYFHVADSDLKDSNSDCPNFS
jgi:hypothetical protein